MKNKLLISLSISLCIVGCAKTDDTLQEDITTEVIEQSTVEHSSEEEIESTEEAITEVMEVKDQITYYNQGYSPTDDLNISVEDSIVSVSSSARDADYFTGKYGVYYWRDRNTRIQDETSLEFKQGVPCFVYTKDGFDKRWDYLFMLDGDGNIINSEYELRVISVDYIKNGDSQTKKFIGCVPRESLYYKGTEDSGDSKTLFLQMISRDGDNSVKLDVSYYLLSDNAEDDVVFNCVSANNTDWRCMFVPYDEFFKSYTLYTKLSDFYVSALIPEPIDYKLVQPMEVEEVNSLVLNSLENNNTLYQQCVDSGIKFMYVIFTFEDNVYETLVVSEGDIDYSSLDYSSYVSSENGIYESNGVIVCNFYEFIKDNETTNTVLNNYYENDNSISIEESSEVLSTVNES